MTFEGGGRRIDEKAPGLFSHGWNFVLDTKYSKTIFAEALSVCMTIFSTLRTIYEYRAIDEI